MACSTCEHWSDQAGCQRPGGVCPGARRQWKALRRSFKKRQERKGVKKMEKLEGLYYIPEAYPHDLGETVDRLVTTVNELIDEVEALKHSVAELRKE